MTAPGPSRHIASRHELGRKRGIAEVEAQPSIAQGDAFDPIQTLASPPKQLRPKRLRRSISFEPLSGREQLSDQNKP